MTPALRTSGLSKSFGDFRANSDVSLAFPHGVRHALIGPNGAGKTTLINLLTGALSPTAGDVFLGDERITALAQHQRVKLGMTRTFQINTLFAGLTVLESVTLAVCERKGRAGIWHRTVARQRDEADEALALLQMLRLSAEANTLTRNLPYGKQRLVEIALALATKPRILLLDEPAAGIPGRRECRAVRGHRRFAEGRDDPFHRARHGARVPFRRADHGARRRQGADRRGARRNRGRPAGPRGVSRRGAAWLSSSRSTASPRATATA